MFSASEDVLDPFMWSLRQSRCKPQTLTSCSFDILSAKTRVYSQHLIKLRNHSNVDLLVAKEGRKQLHHFRWNSDCDRPWNNDNTKSWILLNLEVADIWGLVKAALWQTSSNAGSNNPVFQICDGFDSHNLLPCFHFFLELKSTLHKGGRYFIAIVVWIQSPFQE